MQWEGALKSEVNVEQRCEQRGGAGECGQDDRVAAIQVTTRESKPRLSLQLNGAQSCEANGAADPGVSRSQADNKSSKTR